VAVGAPFASVPPAPDGGTSDAPLSTGTAYVFKGSGSSWTQKDELYDPAEVTSGGQDWFGFNVAIAGKSIVTTAPYNAEGAATGAAYVFPKSGATWSTYPVELTASDDAPGDYLGYGEFTTIGSRYDVVGSGATGSLYFFKSLSGASSRTMATPASVR